MVMMGDYSAGWMFWPFGLAFAGIAALVSIIVIIFWIWMIVDCAKRRFKNNTEKIIWLLVIVFGQIVGAIVYLIVVVMINKSGIISNGEEVRSAKKRR